MWQQAYAMGGNGAAGSGSEPPSMFAQMMPFVLMFAVFYFLLIRPQQKKAREHSGFLNNLKKGDQVVTASGIYGRIAGIAENVVTLEIAKDTRIQVTRASISGSATPAAESNSETAADKK